MMDEALIRKVSQLRAARAFSAEQWAQEKVAAAAKFFAGAGLKAAVLNLSGGIDSAVTLALLARVAAAPNSPLQKIVCLAQPIHSTVAIQARAYEVAKAFGVDIVTLDLSSIHTQTQSIVDSAFAGLGGLAPVGGGFAAGQLRCYLRTPTAYYAAQRLAEAGLGAVVVGTGNKSEDGYLRYFCKAGDGVVDIQLIADLYKQQVFDVGAVLGVPESVLMAAPSADLWEGQTDEEEMGFTYDFVEVWMEYLKAEEQDTFLSDFSVSAREEFLKTGEIAADIHRRNAHKVHFPHNI